MAVRHSMCAIATHTPVTYTLREVLYGVKHFVSGLGHI